MLLVAALPALAYLLLCGLMYFKQREMIYFPQYTRVPVNQTNFALAREGVTLRGWQANRGQRDAIIYFGGNAEGVQAMHEQLAQWLPRHSSYLLAYRGYGASEGEPQEALLLADALALYDLVRTAHPEGNISVIGRSLGSGVASYLASRRPVHRLVLITPFDSLVAAGQAHYPWLPVRWLATDRYESDLHLSGYDKRVLVLRAGKDQVVPPAHADRLAALLPNAEVLDIPEASHDSVLSGRGTAAAIIRFVEN